MSVAGHKLNTKLEREQRPLKKQAFLFLDIFLEAANIFRVGLPLFSRRFGRNEQLCFTDFICLFPNENYNPWSVASQLVAVGMITDQKQKDYIPFQEQMSSKSKWSLKETKMFFSCKYFYDKTIERQIRKLPLFVKFVGRFLALRKDAISPQSWPRDGNTPGHFSLQTPAEEKKWVLKPASFDTEHF